MRRGASPRPIGDPSYFEENGQTGWVRIVDVTGAAQKYLSKTEQYLSPLGESKSVRVNPGDLIMSICATVGKPIILDMPACIHDGFVQLYDLANIDSEYLYYVLQFHEQGFVKKAQPGTQINLNTTIVENEIIFVPQAKVQRKINQVLSTIDNQITQTQSLINKYTAIKQGMMADLFSRGIDTTTGQLRPSFEEVPELYKETVLGWIPVSWEIVELQNIATVERGKFTHRPRDDARCYGGTYPFIQTGNITACKGGLLSDYKQTLTEFGRNVSREFPAGTIAVTIAANIADTAILGIPMCFPDSVVGVVVNQNMAVIRFIEMAISQNKSKLDALAPQSAQKNINLEDLRPLLIVKPSIDEQRSIVKKYDSISNIIHTLETQKKKAELQKKGLMQDLLTGKVPVPV